MNGYFLITAYKKKRHSGKGFAFVIKVDTERGIDQARVVNSLEFETGLFNSYASHPKHLA